MVLALGDILRGRVSADGARENVTVLTLVEIRRARGAILEHRLLGLGPRDGLLGVLFEQDCRAKQRGGGPRRLRACAPERGKDSWCGPLTPPGELRSKLLRLLG